MFQSANKDEKRSRLRLNPRSRGENVCSIINGALGAALESPVGFNFDGQSRI